MTTVRWCRWTWRTPGARVLRSGVTTTRPAGGRGKPLQGRRGGSLFGIATDSAPPLRSEDAAGVRSLALNRPERRNALSLTLLREMISTLAKTAEDTSVHAVVVRGEGPAFCAGHDLSEMTGCSLSSARELFDTCSELMMAIHRLPQPVIAQVHGIATAAGCQLVAACDLAVASDDARFATPGVRIGLFCSTPMVEVSRAVGRKRALEMLLTGELIDARTAADWGLINRVVPRERLAQETLELAARITQRELADPGDRQDRVLRAAGPCIARGVRAGQRGDGSQCGRPRLPRGHRRVPEQARAALAGPRIAGVWQIRADSFSCS